MTAAPGHGNGPDPKLGHPGDSGVPGVTPPGDPQTWYGPLSEQQVAALGMGITVASQSMAWALRTPGSSRRLLKFLRAEARRAGNDAETIEFIDNLTRYALLGAYHALRDGQARGLIPR